jgi:hypothetical protein
MVTLYVLSHLRTVFYYIIQIKYIRELNMAAVKRKTVQATKLLL